MRIKSTLFAWLLFSSVAWAGAAGSGSDLGSIAFPTSGSSEAQKAFIEGVLWLHSFEYPEAREAFQKAQKLDPDFALAYWGEAMSWNHPIWLREDYDKGRAALEKLAPTREERLAKAVSKREKGYLEAVEILFGEGEKRARDWGYAAAMERLHKAHPDDLEAASFYALALLGTCHDGREVPTYMKAAAVVEEVFDKNPRHPGALHYLIHSYDDSAHAPLGLRPARLYASVAPSAAHALHMPSHIFLALGMWDETAASNLDSWKAAEERVKRKKLGVDDLSFHALLWMQYADLQRGRFEDARRHLTIAEDSVRKSGSRGTRYHLAEMRAHYIVNTRQWNASIQKPVLNGLSVNGAASHLFAEGLSALRTGRIDEAQSFLDEMKARRESVETQENRPRRGYSRTVPPDTQRARLMETQLDAYIRLEKGAETKALGMLTQAAAEEEQLPSGFGPPMPIKPSHEILGEVLLKLGRPVEARLVFAKSLEKHPNRALSLLGMARAAQLSGDEEVAGRTYRQLKGIWAKAQAALPPLVAPTQ